MNRYMNAEDRDKHIKLAGALTLLDDIVNWQSGAKQPEKEYLKNARHCRTLLNKMLEKRISYLDAVEKGKLIKDSAKHHLVLRPREMRQIDSRAVKNANEDTLVKKDDFLDCMSWLIERTCKICTNNGADVDECLLRKFFLNYHIEPFNCEATETCPYQYPQEYEAVPIGTIGEEMLKRGVL